MKLGILLAFRNLQYSKWRPPSAYEKSEYFDFRIAIISLCKIQLRSGLWQTAWFNKGLHARLTYFQCCCLV